MNRAAGRVATAAAAALWVAGCRAPAPPLPVPSPNDSCRAVADTLTAAIPPGQSLAELQARGIRVRTPLALPPGSAPASSQPGGAAVQALIAADGSIVPGSPKVLKLVGEAQIADAVEAGALSMAFDIDGTRPSAPVPFTTTMTLCGRS
jgi:hypothetical protein